VAWLRRLAAGLSQWRAGFAPGSDHVVFLVDKVALGHVFLRVMWISPVSIIPQSLSVLAYHLGRNKRPVGGCSSETQSHTIDMNNIPMIRSEMEDHLMCYFCFTDTGLLGITIKCKHSVQYPNLPLTIRPVKIFQCQRRKRRQHVMKTKAM